MEIGCNYYKKPIGTVLEKYKRVLGKVVPTPAGAHVRLKAYDYMSIVYDEDTLVSYISTQQVPEGVEITNRDFWQPLNVSGYADDNIIIVTDKNQSGQLIPYTLEEVLPTIADVARKPGAILSFFSMENGSHWELWQYSNLNNYEWEDTSNWRSLYNEYGKFVGWYNTLEDLQKIYVGTYSGKYAIVGSEMRDAVVYEGRADGWYPLDSNLYQKFFDDLIYNIDNETISLTDDQKASFKAFICGTSDEGCDGDTPSGEGSVKSIGLSMPTGFTVTGSPVTEEGTLEVEFAEGYLLPSAAKQLEWDTAYNWGNHADAGYLLRASVPAWVLNGGKPEYNFSEIKNKPTNLAGYGITDGVTTSQWQVLYDLIRSITPGEGDVPVIAEPIASINAIGHNPSIGSQILVYKNNEWQYTTYSTEGDGSGYDDRWIRTWQTDVDGLLSTLQEELSRWRSEVDILQHNIESSVKGTLANALKDAQWLQENFPVDKVFHLDGWSDEMQGYLRDVGLITQQVQDDGTLKDVVGWTSLAQTVNELEGTVNRIVSLSDGNVEAFISSMRQYIDDVDEANRAITDIKSLWAVQDDNQEVLEWMASGFMASVSSEETFADMYAATNGAIAAVTTRVTDLETEQGTTRDVTASLTTRMNNLDGGPNNIGQGGIYSKITAVEGSVQHVTTLVSSTLNDLSANFVATADLNSAVAALIAADTSDPANTTARTLAAVIATVVGDESVIDIIADNINLTGYTVVDGEAEFTGNIKAKSLTLDEYGYINIGGDDDFADFKLWCDVEGDDSSGLTLQQTAAGSGDSAIRRIVRSVNITNTNGIAVYANESGTTSDPGAKGSVDVGTFTMNQTGFIGQDTRSSDNAFGIKTAYGSNFGIGYNGVISGLRFINGICVGTA